MSKASADYWTNANAAQLYKDRERLTGSIARCLIQQVGLLQAQKGPLIVLDNACGTGVLSSLLYEMLDESAKERLQLTCGDFSEAMVQSTQQRIINSGWKGAKAQVVDAQKTGFPDDFFTHVLTNMGIMLMPNATAALDECFRILESGGVCGISTWGTVGWMPDVREAFATITGAPPFPDHKTLQSSLGDGGQWYRSEYVKQKLADHGFEGIKVEVVPSPVTFDNVPAFVEHFLAMSTQFTAKFWSKDDHAKYSGEIKPALMKHMTKKYPEGHAAELTKATQMMAIVASARKP